MRYLLFLLLGLCPSVAWAGDGLEVSLPLGLSGVTLLMGVLAVGKIWGKHEDHTKLIEEHKAQIAAHATQLVAIDKVIATTAATTEAVRGVAGAVVEALRGTRKDDAKLADLAIRLERAVAAIDEMNRDLGGVEELRRTVETNARKILVMDELSKRGGQ